MAIDLRTLRGSGRPDSTRKADTSFYDFDTDQLVERGEGDQRIYVVAHELGHYLDHVSSAYGHFLDVLRCARQKASSALIKAHLDVGLPILAPAYDLCLEYRDDLETFHQRFPRYDFLPGVWETCVSPWSHAAYLKEAFEDADGRPDEEIDQVLSSLEKVDEWLYRLSEFDGGPKQSGYARSIESYAFAPKVLLPERDYAIDARHVSELLAILYELAGTASQILNPDVHGDYKVLYFASLDHMRRHGYSFDARENFTYAKKIMAMCGQLALYTPLGPSFSSLRAKRPLEWGDVHPGHRYWKALAMATAAVVNGAVISTPELQHMICDAAEWPRVAEFADTISDASDALFSTRRLKAYIERFREHDFGLVLDRDEEEEIFRPLPHETLLTRMGPLLVSKGETQLLRLDARDCSEFIVNHALEYLDYAIMRGRGPDGSWKLGQHIQVPDMTMEDLVSLSVRCWRD